MSFLFVKDHENLSFFFFFFFLEETDFHENIYDAQLLTCRHMTKLEGNSSEQIISVWKTIKNFIRQCNSINGGKKNLILSDAIKRKRIREINWQEQQPRKAVIRSALPDLIHRKYFYLI